MLADRSGRPSEEDVRPADMAPPRVFREYVRFVLGLDFVPRPTRFRLVWLTLSRVGGALVPLSLLAYVVVAVLSATQGEDSGWSAFAPYCQQLFFLGLALRMASVLGNLLARDLPEAGAPPAEPLPRWAKVFFTLGGLLLLATLTIAVETEVRYLRLPKAEADVSVDHSRGGVRGATFTFVVEDHEVQANVGGIAAFYDLDEERSEIAYDPRDPTRVQLGVPVFACLFIGIFGVAFTVMGFVGRAVGTQRF